MTNPLGITGRSANNFGLKINPKYGKHFNANIGQQKGDLRDRYSTEASIKRMGFSSYEEYQNFMWESNVRQEEVQQAADQEAISNTTSGLGAIVDGIKSIISLF